MRKFEDNDWPRPPVSRPEFLDDERPRRHQTSEHDYFEGALVLLLACGAACVFLMVIVSAISEGLAAAAAVIAEAGRPPN